jgi:hypothetical protein
MTITTPPSAADEGELVIKPPDHRSPSSVCKFCRCPRLFAWSKLVGLERSSPTRDLALSFGTAIHAAAPFTWDRNIEGAFLAFAESWAEGDAAGDPKRNTLTAKKILSSLCDLHGASSWPYACTSRRWT